jgi:hypothetical protein
MNSNGDSMKVVFTVVDRGPGKSFWTRVGVGFVNRDGSITLRLDALPTNGTLQVRDWEERDSRAQESAAPVSMRQQRPREGLASSNAPARGPNDAPGGLA